MGYGSTLPEPELDCWFFRRKGLQLKSGGSGARGVASAGGGCRIAYSRRVRASDDVERVPIGCRTPGAEGLFSIAGRSADPECAGVAGVAGVARVPVLPVLPTRRNPGVAGGGPAGGTGTPSMCDSVCTRSLCCTLKA